MRGPYEVGNGDFYLKKASFRLVEIQKFKDKFLLQF